MQLQIDCRKALGSFDDTDPEVDDQLLKATPQVEQFWQEFVRTEICHVSHRDDKDKKEAALNKVIDVSNIRQPLQNFDGNYTPASLLIDCVIENTQTTEVGQFYLTDDTVDQPVDFVLMKNCASRYEEMFGITATRNLLCYLQKIDEMFCFEQLPFVKKQKKIFRANNYIELMKDLEASWQFTFVESPTRFLLRDVSQVEKVLNQKRLLRDEITRLQTLTYADYALRFEQSENLIREFDETRKSFIDQLRVGLS